MLVAVACGGSTSKNLRAPIQLQPCPNPSSLVAGTFHSDGGAVDLVVPCLFDGTVALLAGNGDGTFQAPTTTAVPAGNGERPATGDFNGDGKLDLAVTGFLDGGVAVLLGNGDGTFRPPALQANGLPAQGIVAARFLHPGTLDLATSLGSSFSSSTRGVALLPGLGDGGFSSPLVSPTTGSMLSGPTVGMLTPDGGMDLLVAVGPVDGGFGVQPLAATPGGFIVASSLVPFPLAGAVAVADLNGDGIADILTLDGTSLLETALGNGDGTFKAAQTFPTQGQPLDLAVADFNGDGIPDVAVANWLGLPSGGLCNVSGAGSVGILLGNGDGTFQAVQLFPAGEQPNTLAIADFNRDGKPDVAALDAASGNVEILINAWK